MFHGFVYKVYLDIVIALVFGNHLFADEIRRFPHRSDIEGIPYAKLLEHRNHRARTVSIIQGSSQRSDAFAQRRRRIAKVARLVPNRDTFHDIRHVIVQNGVYNITFAGIVVIEKLSGNAGFRGNVFHRRRSNAAMFEQASGGLHYIPRTSFDTADFRTSIAMPARCCI